MENDFTLEEKLNRHNEALELMKRLAKSEPEQVILVIFPNVTYLRTWFEIFTHQSDLAKYLAFAGNVSRNLVLRNGTELNFVDGEFEQPFFRAVRGKKFDRVEYLPGYEYPKEVKMLAGMVVRKAGK